ncbi:MAG: IS200/IS605 family transposase [Armatimonadetes bacterium]|nr:IS200/IS605 family transposase [Armatimonadota bacterium]
MPQSIAQVYLHAVFSTKNRNPIITKEMQPELYAYIGSVCKSNGIIPVKFGGVEDHVHLLFGMPRTITIAKTIETIKTSSSKWAKEKFDKNFAWQTGYGVFGVSYHEVATVVNYISNQESHHQKFSFKDEFRALLKEYGIDVEETYLWD